MRGVVVAVVAACAFTLACVGMGVSLMANADSSDPQSQGVREAAEPRPPASPVVDAVDPSVHAAVVATYPLDVQPSMLAAGGGAVWLGAWVGNCSAACGVLRRIDVSSGASVATLVLRKSPKAITATEDAVWVVMTRPDGSPISVARIDTATNAVDLDIDIPGTSIAGDGGRYDVAASDTSIWVARGMAVYCLDRETGEVTATIAVPGSVAGIEIVHGVVWIAEEGGKIVRIDPVTNEVTVPAARPPTYVHGLATDGEHLWFTDVAPEGVTRGELIEFDPETTHLTITDIATAHVVAGAGQLWVQGDASDLVHGHDDAGFIGKLDGATRFVRTTRLPVSRSASLPAAVDDTGLWLADYETATLYHVR